jgi:hypothetical protein
MADDGPIGKSDPPQASGTRFLQGVLLEMSRPVLDRFGEHLGFADSALVVRAASQESHPSADAASDWIRREICRRVLPAWAAAIDVPEEDARRALGAVRAQLDDLPGEGKPKRVYYALAALDRVASRPADAFVAAGQALAMTRNTVDQNKARALEYARAGTCLAPVPGFRLSELHFFVVDLPHPCVSAARRLLAALREEGLDLAEQIDAAHAQANARRRRYEEKRKEAQRAWNARLAAALDASGTRPIDAELRFFAEARAAHTAPEDVPARVRQRWQTLRLVGAVPSRVLPATTWAQILAKAPRPPTFVLDGAWGALVEPLGPVTRAALAHLLHAAHEADEAHRAWNDAAELTYQTTRGRPSAVSHAIETFNINLDWALRPSAKGIAR